MRAFAVVVFLVLFDCPGFGQTGKTINIPSYGRSNDTLFWQKWQHARDDKMELPHLFASTDTFAFRAWLDGQMVEIRTRDYKTFTGVLTNYVESHEETKSKTPRKKSQTTFISRVQIDSAIARKVFELVKTVISIPSQDSIDGWNRGLDGITYIFESSTPSYYSFKSYWTPSAQDSSLTEANQILDFIKTLDVLLDMQGAKYKFYETLKPGAYTLDHWGVMFKPSERQNKKWKKYEPHWNYMETVRDTLNHYLSDTLTKIFLANNISIEPRQYFLYLSRHNRLKKIRTNYEFFLFSDRLEFARDKRKIRKAFRKIRIHFVQAKRSYGVELNYYDREVLIL